MSGKELFQAIIEGRLPQAPISQTMSLWIVEIGDGLAAFEGDPGLHLLNPMGTVRGGGGLTLIDSVAACAGGSLLPAGAAFTLSRPKTRARRSSRRVPGTANHFLRGE